MVNKPKVFGTGLSGMIGSRLVELYHDELDFINLDITTGVDITDSDLVASALAETPGSTVIHLAAYTDVSKAYAETGNQSGLVYRVNVAGTRNIAAACRRHGHYLIHISTDFVFDGVNPPAGGYTETDRPHPIEWYGQTKYWAEEEILKSGCRAVICRTAFPYRAKFDLKLDLIRKIAANLKNKTLMPMFSDQIITPTFIDDLCRVLKIFIDKKPVGIYHVVGSTSLSPLELAQKIAAVLAISGPVKPGNFKDFLKTDPRPRQQFLKISNVKLYHDFGYKMKTIDQALKVLKSQL